MTSTFLCKMVFASQTDGALRARGCYKEAVNEVTPTHFDYVEYHTEI